MRSIVEIDTDGADTSIVAADDEGREEWLLYQIDRGGERGHAPWRETNHGKWCLVWEAGEGERDSAVFDTVADAMMFVLNPELPEPHPLDHDPRLG